VGRQGVGEEIVETPDLGPRELADYARAWKARAGEVFEAAHYRWIVFLDADCLCLRNIDHLLSDRDCGILYQPESGRDLREAAFNGYLTPEEMESAGGKPMLRRGISSGIWAVRGACFQEVMQEWTRIQEEQPMRETPSRDQSAWNRLILDAARHGWSAEPFEAREIQFPLSGDKDWRLYKDAAIVHCAGGSAAEKTELMFGLYMQRFFHDPACTLLNVVEM
jgi:hypothetical protein